MFGKQSIEGNIIDIEDIDSPIYRIFSVGRFSEVIAKRENGLVHPSMWDDPFENFFLKNVAATSGGELVDLSSLSRSWYGQCWTRREDSDAMWRIYSRKKEGVRVRTTVRALFSAFFDSNDKYASLKFLIGSVRYKTRQEIERFLADTTFADLALGGQPHRFADTLLIKRPEFAHEDEVRLLFHDSEGRHGKDGVANFPFAWDEILTEVTLDPRLTEAEYPLQKQRLIDLGCTIPITQSELYKFSPTIIKLD